MTHHSDQPLPCCVKINFQAYIGRASSSVDTVQVWLSSSCWGEGNAVADGEETDTPLPISGGCELRDRIASGEGKCEYLGGGRRRFCGAGKSKHTSTYFPKN